MWPLIRVAERRYWLQIAWVTGGKMSEDTRDTGADTANRILVPLDDSAEARVALPYAVALATPGTEIILLTVVRPGADADAARTGLETAAQRLRVAGPSVRTEVAVGNPAERIVHTAVNLNAEMIVMASHGRGALGRLIHGSVADRVAREATIPTMVVRARQVEPGPVGITRLVVPLDGSLLAEAALPVAAAISQRLGTPLLLVRVVDPAVLMPPAVGIDETIPFEIYDDAEKEMEQVARTYLDAMAQKLRDQNLRVATSVLMGPPAIAIEEVTHLGDVLVLSSHERTRVMRWLLGSVAEKLTREDESPVILAPPSAPDHARD
jgi:nucleotide-binding universal stress UspA family protein